MKILVTGGAGLVGSSLIRSLLDRGARVFCADNLLLGTHRHLEDVSKKPEFEFEKWDVSQPQWYQSLKGRSFDAVFALAANSDISLGNRMPIEDVSRTLLTTIHTLEAIRELKIPSILFSSSSAVYGKDPKFPTPESTTNLYPVSIYGAGKLSSEAYISAYVENYGLNAWVFRFGNVVGKRLTHGVIYDFIKKLRVNSALLPVLGDGNQSKTYIDVEDCVSGMLMAFEKSLPKTEHRDRFQVFNLSTEGATSVRAIAAECVRVAGHSDTRVTFESQPIGWIGDVPRTSLDVARISQLGWKPNKSSDQAVFQSIRQFHDWYK